MLLYSHNHKNRPPYVKERSSSQIKIQVQQSKLQKVITIPDPNWSHWNLPHLNISPCRKTNLLVLLMRYQFSSCFILILGVANGAPEHPVIVFNLNSSGLCTPNQSRYLKNHNLCRTLEGPHNVRQKKEMCTDQRMGGRWKKPTARPLPQRLAPLRGLRMKHEEEFLIKLCHLPNQRLILWA